MVAALSLAVLVTAVVLLSLGNAFVTTWFYSLVWYPTLLLLDRFAAGSGTVPLFSRPRLMGSLLGWSAVIWFGFEAVNFRLENWYYVFLPRALPARWIGIAVAFATVVPAVVLAERALARAGLGRAWRPRPLRLGVRRPAHLSWAGLVVLGLVLWWPQWFYPLVWGAVLLVVDPVVYARRRDLSLLGDVERGHWGRIVRLMVGGAGIGFLWESYNYWARAKWIYTVPLLEDLKWFEMPPLGFVGFPFFALEAWAMYQVLVVAGVAVGLPEGSGPEAIGDDQGRSRAMTGDGDRRWARPATVTAAIALSVATLFGMERYTISSTAPALGDAGPGLAGVGSVWQLARVDADSLAVAAALPPDSVRTLVQRAQVATLRGIGMGHASALARTGVHSVCELAGSDPERLWPHLHAINDDLGRRPTAAEVRVWQRAARRACPP